MLEAPFLKGRSAVAVTNHADAGAGRPAAHWRRAEAGGVCWTARTGGLHDHTREDVGLPLSGRNPKQR